MHTYYLIRTNLGCVVAEDEAIIESYPTQTGIVNFILSHLSDSFIIFASPGLSRAIELCYLLNRFSVSEAVKIASPRLANLNRVKDIVNDVATIKLEVNLDVHPALGGPRELTFDDFIYGVCNSSMDQYPLRNIFPYMAEHSYWIPGNWFYVADVESLSRFMASIGDPRWYLEDTVGNSRYKHLYSILGLDKYTFYSALEGRDSLIPAIHACRSWYSFGNLQTILDTGNPDQADAINIFMREFYEKIHAKSRRHFPRIMYNITKKFVSSFCEGWASFLNARSKEDMIVSTDFGEYTEAYKDYVGVLFPTLLTSS